MTGAAEPIPTGKNSGVAEVKAMMMAQDDAALADLFGLPREIGWQRLARWAGAAFVGAVEGPDEARRQTSRDWLRARGLMEPKEVVHG